MSDMDFIEAEMVVIEDELTDLDMAQHHLEQAELYLNGTKFLDIGDNNNNLNGLMMNLLHYIKEREINLEELDDRRTVNELFAG